jgi:hypothetical protein
MCLYVEAMWTYRRVLNNVYFLDLENTFYVPLFFRNFISISRLMYFGYYFNFIDTELIISHNKVSIDFECLLNRLFKLKLD